MSLTVANVNVAGLRGATLTGKAAKVGHGFDVWFKDNKSLDILAIQETKVTQLEAGAAFEKLGIKGSELILLPDGFKKGHAGVMIWFNPATVIVHDIRTPMEDVENAEELWFSGRWIEADISPVETPQKIITICNGYFHHADSPIVKDMKGNLIDRGKSETSMYNKHKFMAATTGRIRELISEGREIIILGDINIAHHDIDIKNFKGNFTKAGFLPEERAWLDLWELPLCKQVPKILKDTYKENLSINYAPPKTAEFSKGGLGLVDVVRQAYRDKPIYTWWTNMGHAFDNDAGWRIDYQFATPSLATIVKTAEVQKQASYATRWSDHAPVVVTYAI